MPVPAPNSGQAASDISDCLIVGGGPAGLTAAIYLARFHLSVTVVDAGHGRASLIPLTRNLAGFPGGIAGRDLLARMREQALSYGTDLREATVTTLTRAGGGFVAHSGDGAVLRSRAVLLATGVMDRRPPIDDDMHARALAAGLLRYCPICDGFEVTDRRVAVLGTGKRGCAEATFIRNFTRDVTLVAPAEGHDLSPDQIGQLATAGVAVAGRLGAIALQEDQIMLDIDGTPTAFDSLYPALGSTIRSELAAQLDAERSAEGCLPVDAHQRTSIAGLYAAGDVVLGLDQISHAMGEGGVAATTIRNDLAALRPLYR